MSRHIKRCAWVTDDPTYIRYHDEEWGRPVHDDIVLFEFLILEAAQAGLSWITVLKRRAGYKKAFADFDPQLVAAFSDQEAERLQADSGIIRNKLKIRAAIQNAKVFLAVQAEFGSFSTYLWQFTDGKVELGHQRTTSDLSDEVSKDLKRRGMSFVGSTIIYAYLQAVGVINDHEPDCYLG